MSTVRIGTRGSMLALWQSKWVGSELARLHDGVEAELEIIKTRGDKIQDTPLAKVGGKGLFVKEIETALLSGDVDLAVHSLKDVPTEQPEGLYLAAFPERVDWRDALISRDGSALADLPEGALIGTSSLRRVAQLKRARPDLRFDALRGNVDTRLRKLQEGQADAIILACAGLDRLGYSQVITERLAPDVMLPAAGQGILAIEAREDDARTLDLLKPMDCAASRACATAERHVIAALDGSCQVPIGALARVREETFVVEALVASLDGTRVLRANADGQADQAEALAADVVRSLLGQGAAAILAEATEDA